MIRATRSHAGARLTLLAGLIALALPAQAGRREVEDAPRWMTEKDTVRFDIVRKLLEGEDPARALELIRLMREDGVDEPQLGMLHGIALRQQGMVEDAERMLAIAAKQMPRNPDVHRELCVLYADEQLIEPALESCERATELDPKSAAGWNNLGFLRMTFADDFEGARVALERAVELDGTEARYRNNLAYAQAATGDHKAALKTFLTTGTPADAHYNVGTSYERGGDTPNALAYYGRALKLNRDHLLAQESIERLQGEVAPLNRSAGEPAEVDPTGTP